MFKKLFGKKDSSCCDVIIEEVKEEKGTVDSASARKCCEKEKEDLTDK